MRMSATAGVRTRPVGLVPLIPDPVPVFRDRLDVGIRVLLEMFPGLTLKAPALHDVEQMRNDAAGQKRVAVVVEIDSPRIARSPGENLELFLRRMVAPDARVDARALVVF